MNHPTLSPNSNSNSSLSNSPVQATQTRDAQRQNIEDIYPLSPMQQGMLFHSLLMPNAGVYVPQITFALKGELERDRLRQAWEMAVSACSVLRTSFHWEKRDQPFQVVKRQVNLPWVEQDWRGCSAEVQAEKLSIFLECDRAQGFNLKAPPLMRLALIHCGEEQYQLIFSYHHLILDGWSAGNLIRTVFEQYFKTQKTDFKGLKIRPYGDYIAWLNQQDGPAAEQYWKTYLQGFTEATPLPLEQSPLSQSSAQSPANAQRAKQQAPQLQQQQLILPEADTASLKAFAQQHQLTINTLMQGAFALLLSRYGDRQDVLFGATCAGRPGDLTGVESMVGLFINSLPVRVKLPPQMGLIPWLQQLQQERAMASSYEYSALSQIQTLSELPAGNPLFRSLLVFENYPVDTSLLERQAQQNDLSTTPDAAPSLAFENLNFNEWTSFPLTLLVSVGNGLNLTIKYDLDCFSEAAIRQLLDHLQTLLIEISLKPHAALAQLKMLSLPERQQLLAWSQARAADDESLGSAVPEEPASQQSLLQPSLEHGLHRHFEAQAEKTPTQLAVRFGQTDLTYQELNARANQLAYRLQELGVGPEVPVAVYLARSPQLVITILAILKAGGCYVPLDPDYPPERLAWMLEDVGTSHLILDSSQGLDTLPIPASVSSLDLAQSLDLEQLPTTNLRSDSQNAVQPHNSIYVIYTSGSTGRPKGVINTHRGVVNRLVWMQETYGLEESDRVLQKTSFSFDVSVWEFFWPLLNGAALVLAKPGGHRDSAYLAQLIQQEQITTLHFVPSMLRAFLEVPDLAAKCTSLKRVICSGEALSVGLKNQFFDCLLTELYNLYGPTEAAIDVTAWRCLPEVENRSPNATSEASSAQSVPIGYPIANTQIYLLDSRHCPLPQGCSGEICIGGVGLARGYWNRPDLTAERFIPNPFYKAAKEQQSQSITPNGESAYLYRTGDLGRYRSDGALDYLGRMDQQLKLRGFRIETGEIEARLTQHSAVKQSVVLLREDQPGSPQLVAYVVLSEVEAELSNHLKAQLQSWLAQSLPDYMVPNMFISLAVLPLTANGKLNRRALPGPNAPSATQPVVPRTATERAIAEIWQALLPVDAISIHDNFFELGGHSLMATRANSRLQSSFGLELPLQTIFERPTIAGLAARIEALTLAQSMANSPVSSPPDTSSKSPGSGSSASPPPPNSPSPNQPTQPRRKEIEL